MTESLLGCYVGPNDTWVLTSCLLHYGKAASAFTYEIKQFDPETEGTTLLRNVKNHLPSLQQTNFHRLSATYRDPVVVRIASVVLSAETEDRVRPVLISQQHFVVLTLVHLGLVPVCGVPIL